VLGIAVALVLNAFQSNLAFFFSPTDVVENKAPQGRTFGVGAIARHPRHDPRGCALDAPHRRKVPP
jgi:cytochrome c-type biogenesis protein CcmE